LRDVNGHTFGGLEMCDLSPKSIKKERRFGGVPYLVEGATPLDKRDVANEKWGLGNARKTPKGARENYIQIPGGPSYLMEKEKERLVQVILLITNPGTSLLYRRGEKGGQKNGTVLKNKLKT